MTRLVGTFKELQKRSADIPYFTIRPVAVRPTSTGVVVDVPVRVTVSNGSFSVNVEPGPAVITPYLADNHPLEPLFILVPDTTEYTLGRALADYEAWAPHHLDVVTQLRDQMVDIERRTRNNADNAAASATTASTKAREAAASAATASSKASEATTKAREAAASAATASQKAGEATTKAREAAASAATASSKASEAERHKNAAAGSATTASQKASEAAASATTASTKAREAAASATTASQKASEAERHKNAAETAKRETDTIRSQALTAVNAARDAGVKAVNDTKTAAVAAAGTAITNAQNDAVRTVGRTRDDALTQINGKVNDARAAASAAEQSKNAAAASATTAEQKASEAGAKARDAAISAGAVFNKANEVERHKNAAADSADTAGAAAARAESSKQGAQIMATQARDSARDAATKATEAAASAERAESAANTGIADGAVAWSKLDAETQKKIDSHKHVIADISDLDISEEPKPFRVVKRGLQGEIKAAGWIEVDGGGLGGAMKVKEGSSNDQAEAKLQIWHEYARSSFSEVARKSYRRVALKLKNGDTVVELQSGGSGCDMMVNDETYASFKKFLNRKEFKIRDGVDLQLTGSRPTPDDNSVMPKRYIDTEVAKKANSSHTHAIANVTGLQAALDGKVNTNDSRLTNARTPTSHTHPSSQISDATTNFGHTSLVGKVLKLNSYGNIEVKSGVGSDPSLFRDGEVVPKKTVAAMIAAAVAGKVNSNDSRLTNARTPTAHTHTISQISDLQNQLNSKATKADITNVRGTESTTPGTNWPYVKKLDECEITIGPVRRNSVINLPFRARIRTEFLIGAVSGDHYALLTVDKGSTRVIHTERMRDGVDYWVTLKYSI